MSGRDVAADGIIKPRKDGAGGPYYLYACPQCRQENLCERTRAGTLFASPPYRPTLLEWLFEKLGPAENAETFLRIVGWHHEKSDFRQYVFERDEDFRYASFKEKIGACLRRWMRIKSAPPKAVKPASVPSPYAILGVQPGASRETLKKAFLTLVKKCHPDKHHHLGPQYVRHAEARFKKLLAAYEKLTKK